MIQSRTEASLERNLENVAQPIDAVHTGPTDVRKEVEERKNLVRSWFEDTR